MTELNEIHAELIESLDTLRELRESLRRNLLELSNAGMNVVTYEEYLYPRIARVTDSDHEYLARDVTLENLVNAVEAFMEESSEVEGEED
jgi:hypothetical protein